MNFFKIYQLSIYRFFSFKNIQINITRFSSIVIMMNEFFFHYSTKWIDSFQLVFPIVILNFFEFFTISIRQDPNVNVLIMAKILHLESQPSTESESESESKMGKKFDPHLYRIILFQTIFGCSYMGEYFHPNELKTFPRCLILTFVIIQGILYAIPTTWIWYISATSYSADFLYKETTVHNTMDYLARIFHICIMMKSIFDKWTNIFRGRRIIAIMNDIGSLEGNHLSHRIIYYRLIYVFMAFMMAMYAISFSFFAIFIENQTISFSFSFIISGILYGINISWITVIHIYTAILVNERIQSK